MTIPNKPQIIQSKVPRSLVFWLRAITLLLGCIMVVLIAIMVHEFSLNEVASEMMKGQAFSPAEEALAKAIQDLGQRINSLHQILAPFGHAENDGSSESNIPDRIRIDPSTSNLETSIERLINVLEKSILTSGHNIVLRERLEEISNWTPVQISDIWNSRDEAMKALFMQSYSQVLNKMGPPEYVISGGGLSAEWHYKDGWILFVDGYVGNISNGIWK